MGKKKAPAAPLPAQAPAPQTWAELRDVVSKQALRVLADPGGVVQGDHLCSLQALPKVVLDFFRTNRPGEADKQHVQALSATLLTMLDKVLAAKKRTRDMAKAPYQASITAVLSASSGVRTLQQDMSWTQPSIADTIPKVAAAMVEATRLLSAHKQQQQRGPPSPAPEQLQLLAGELLLWCLAVMGTALMRHEWVNGTSLQLCAVELAALLAQHLGLDPGSVTKEHSVTVFQVLDRVYFLLMNFATVDPNNVGTTWAGVPPSCSSTSPC